MLSISDPAPQARVSARGAQRWARGHPWIYRSDVLRFPDAEAGAVRVEGPAGDPLGWALWSPASKIALRWLAAAEADPAPPGAEFWRGRLEAAFRLRSSLSIDATAYRLVHAEADGLPSVVADRYGEVVVLQTLSAGAERYRDAIADALEACLRPRGILARNDPPVRAREGLPRETLTLRGDVPRELEVREGAIRYIADLHGGQKTGAFLDQRVNRAAVGVLARGRALDAFSYQGSFALHLAAGGAREVVAVDSSAPALERARENAALNGFADVIRTREENVFDFLRAEWERGARYDTIVLDPPAFAKTRRALPKAVAAYKEINLRSLQLLAPGGFLFSASCSYHLRLPGFLEMIRSACADCGRRVRRHAILVQAPDHPEIPTIPETAYLKGVLLQVLD